MNQLKHLYINPLEQCNLHCQICYTNKISTHLTQTKILDFVYHYRETLKKEFKKNLETITFCGGEVFLLPDFIQTVNKLTAQNIFVQIITNGTFENKLCEFKQPNLINLIVSIDGDEKYHDLNRGQGNFQRSWNFLKRASTLNFHREIFQIVTQENFSNIEKFENLVKQELGCDITITYHPRKPKTYLAKHPSANKLGQVDNFNFLNSQELANLKQRKKIFPPAKLTCWQISLMANGLVYACCEGPTPIGKISDPMTTLIANLQKKLLQNKNCPYPNFKCGLE